MDLTILIYVFLIVAFAKAFGEIASRVGQPAIVGELLAGIVLGPALLGAVFPGLEDMYTNDFIRELGELGILFFMLYVGMETSPRLLRTTSRYGILVAAGGIFVPLLLGSLLGVFFDLGGLTLVFVALAVSITALPVTIRILTDLEVLKTRTSGVIISAALITDIILLFALGVVLGTDEQGETAGTALYLSLSIVAFFALALLIGRFAVPRLYKLLLWMRTGEAAFAIAVGLAIVLAVLAEWAGLPAVIGAFIAGMLLREAGTGLRVWSHVEDVLSGVTLGFLAPIFFVFIGFSVNFGTVASNIALFAAILGVAIFGKLVGSFIPARTSNLGRNESIAIGGMMMGKGAMELVFAQLALDQGLIDEALFSLLVLMAFISTVIAPIIFRIYYNRAVEADEITQLDEDLAIQVPLPDSY